MTRPGNLRFALSLSKGGRACCSCFDKLSTASALGDPRQ